VKEEEKEEVKEEIKEEVKAEISEAHRNQYAKVCNDIRNCPNKLKDSSDEWKKKLLLNNINVCMQIRNKIQKEEVKEENVTESLRVVIPTEEPVSPRAEQPVAPRAPDFSNANSVSHVLKKYNKKHRKN
jgi:hypothetical protein